MPRSSVSLIATVYNTNVYNMKLQTHNQWQQRVETYCVYNRSGLHRLRVFSAVLIALHGESESTEL